MELRHFEGVDGKRDQYQIDPRLLKVRPDFNIRDLTSQKAREGLDVLKEQIRHQGVIEALEIEFDGETPWINEGHRRHLVVMELIGEGEQIKTIPCIPEKRGTKPEQRTLHMLMRKKEDYEPLEYAAGVARMINVHGWEPTKLAAELGFKSKVSIEQYLDMLAMPDAVKAQVTNNEVSATLALQVTKQNGAAAAPAILKQAKAQVEASGSKRTRITPKAVAKVTGKSSKQKDTNDRYLDFVSVAGKIDDEAKRAGGVDKIAPERLIALSKETVTTLARAKGQKVGEAQTEAPTQPFIAEVETPPQDGPIMGEAAFLERMGEQSRAGAAAALGDSMEREFSDDEVTLKPPVEITVTQPNLKALVSAEITSFLGEIAKIAEDNALGERDPDEGLSVPVALIARGDRLYRQIIGDV